MNYLSVLAHVTSLYIMLIGLVLMMPTIISVFLLIRSGFHGGLHEVLSLSHVTTKWSLCGAQDIITTIPASGVLIIIRFSSYLIILKPYPPTHAFSLFVNFFFFFDSFSCSFLFFVIEG